MDKNKKKKCSKTNYQAIGIAVGISLGSGFGTIMFAVTGEAFWIAIGSGIGVAFGPVISKLYTKRCKEKSENNQ